DGDLNTSGSNGCEYACTVQSDVDHPDPDNIDTNCDGIDGNIDGAIFVSPLGSDAATGTIAAPLRSIPLAIARANTSDKDVYVAGGTYALNTTINLENGVSIFGGFSATDWGVRGENHVSQINV